MENTFSTSSELSHSTEPMHTDWAITARWARFLAIVSYVTLGILTLGLILLFVTIGNLPALDLGSDNPLFFLLMSSGAIGAIFGLFFLGFSFVLTTFMFRFARKLREALMNDEQRAFEEAWLHFRNYFRWAGIFTLGLIAFYIVFIVSTLAYLSGGSGLGL